MAKDESHDSLDFTEAEPAKPAAAVAARRKPAPKAQAPKPAGSRKLFASILAAIAIAAVIAFVMKEEAPPQPAAPSSSAQSAPQTPAQSAPAQAAPQPYPPPVPTATPRTAAPPALETVRAMPREFLKAVQAYNMKPGYKAIALALDSNGKWAYGSISGVTTQPGANDGALSECNRQKPKSGAQSDCRLFAVGDKVVW